MKNLFKIKRPHRSNEIPSSSGAGGGAATLPSPSPSPPTCGSDNQVTSSSSSSSSSSSAAVAAITSPALTSPVEAGRTTAAVGGDRQDYYSSEEEFQVQLALALSASNSDFRRDPDGDQIREAKLLSLGRQRTEQDREEGTAESLSRRYWDYNVLDYHEKVIDGFYDIFGLSAELSRQGKMPSLVDLQTGIGDLGFEVIVVNRAIDTGLVELEQIAQCILLDCPVAGITLLVQRISELVTDNMGGPVKDANDMLARWIEKSTELRTSLQTSLLPIGCIKIGLSRHRALLFKVLSDNVGIPCKLVKGSHYTGVDDDAVNIIKLDNEREFLVDLMAAPGTLIPADVLSAKGSSSNYNPRLSKNLNTRAANSSADDFLKAETSNINHKTGNVSFADNDNRMVDERSRYERTMVPSAENAHSGTSYVAAGGSSSGVAGLVSQEQSDQFSTSTSSSSNQKDVVASEGVVNLRNGTLNSSADSQETVDSRNLFADLNPFQASGIGRTSSPFKGADNRNPEYQRRRENIASGPGRTQQPLVWKNWSASNDVPNNKNNNFVEGLYPRRNIGDNIASSSQMPRLVGKTSEVNVAGRSEMSYSATFDNSDNKRNGPPALQTSYVYSGVKKASERHQYGESDSSYVKTKADRQIIAVQSPGDKYTGGNRAKGYFLQNSMQHEAKEHGENVNYRHDPKKCPHDRFLGTTVESKDSESSVSPSSARPSRLDQMLDDVPELEIQWEELVIGERIGLGSYGEVYRADWNGTEVAVKKFLDQDFYGDALDEFRSEVRIMRRLRHPNVVLFMGAVTRPPNLSIVSEFLPRGSLYRILHRPTCQIDEKRRIKMALDVAKGMNCLHTSMPTIVHRDLKSPNLLVDKNWTVKVCDFGLSRLKHNTFLSSKSTAGTPEWMAPEVLRNEPSNEKCDVYSFGVILWELATLRMPWTGMNPMQVVGAVGFQDRRLDIPNEVDPLVGRIIWECWQTDPSLRPSFVQLTTALKSLQRLVIPSHQDAQSPPMPQEISVNSTP